MRGLSSLARFINSPTERRECHMLSSLCSAHIMLVIFSIRWSAHSSPDILSKMYDEGWEHAMLVSQFFEGDPEQNNNILESRSCDILPAFEKLTWSYDLGYSTGEVKRGKDTLWLPIIPKGYRHFKHGPLKHTNLSSKLASCVHEALSGTHGRVSCVVRESVWKQSGKDGKPGSLVRISARIHNQHAQPLESIDL